MSGGYDVVCADECPPAAGQWRLTRVHDGRHPGVLVHAGVGAVDYPTAPTVGSAAHWIDRGASQLQVYQTLELNQMDALGGSSVVSLNSAGVSLWELYQ